MKSSLFLFILLLNSCASKPVLYPNAKFEEAGAETAKLDIEICRNKAKEYLSSSKGKQALKGAGRGSVFGAVVGGAIGLVTGQNLGQAAARGATVGAASGAAQSAITPDQLKRRYVDACLSQKGYRVLGWD